MRLFPREEQFFDYFRQQVKLINTASDLLVEGVAAGDAQLTSAAHQIRSMEEQGDQVMHELHARLNETFITPIDPEDIHNLSSSLDDVLDGIEDAVHRIREYKVNPLPPTVLELCKLVQSCGRTLANAFEALGKSQKFIEYCTEVNRLEETADQLERSAISDLFEHESDAIRVIKLKEIYNYLEQTTDRCEDVADALQSVQVKNS